MKYTQESLIKWATERLAGCDGGNLVKAKIWTCGIEWGWAQSTEDMRKKYYTKDILSEITNQKKLIDDFVVYDKSRLSSRYDRQFLKLLAVIKGYELSEYLSVVINHNEIFKMNLFPIAFQRDYNNLWTEYNLDKTFEQFPTKDTYREWCRLHRFPFFQLLTEKYQPQIILCFGLGYAKDFCNAFGGVKLIEYNTLIDTSPRNSKPRTFYYSKTKSGANLFVLPFLVNRNGLNSSYLLTQAGLEINSIIKGKDILKS